MKTSQTHSPRLYRCAYRWPDGRVRSATFRARPGDALRWAADYVRIFTLGELLAIEEHPSQPVARPVLRLLP